MNDPGWDGRREEQSVVRARTKLREDTSACKTHPRMGSFSRSVLLRMTTLTTAVW